MSQYLETGSPIRHWTELDSAQKLASIGLGITGVIFVNTAYDWGKNTDVLMQKLQSGQGTADDSKALQSIIDGKFVMWLILGSVFIVASILISALFGAGSFLSVITGAMFVFGLVGFFHAFYVKNFFNPENFQIVKFTFASLLALFFIAIATLHKSKWVNKLVGNTTIS
jgi:drug/metabolite transporter (DMT)-like permease